MSTQIVSYQPSQNISTSYPIVYPPNFNRQIQTYQRPQYTAANSYLGYPLPTYDYLSATQLTKPWNEYYKKNKPVYPTQINYMPHSQLGSSQNWAPSKTYFFRYFLPTYWEYPRWYVPRSGNYFYWPYPPNY